MDALAAAYDAYAPALYRAARALLGSSEDAQDVVQDVFVAVARMPGGVDRIDNLQAYLFTALRRAAWERLSQRRREAEALRQAPVATGPPATPAGLPAARQADLEAALARLPAEQREVIALKIDADLTFAQVAAVLGLSANTAASRYRYALEKLRDLLQ